jgi:hypothetical protein
MKLLWPIIALIVASLSGPDLVLAQRGADSAAAGSPSWPDEAGNPGPPWTRRPTIERAGPGGRAEGAPVAGTSKATTRSATEDPDRPSRSDFLMDKLLEKKMRSICRGC